VFSISTNTLQLMDIVYLAEWNLDIRSLLRCQMLQGLQKIIVLKICGTGGQKMANEQRLIDANALLEKMEHASTDVCADYGDGFCEHGYSTQLFRLMVSETPTVDAVEVVRCKDCVHYVNLLCSGSDYRCSIFSGCYDRPYPTNADDFCSYGERKDNG
jgi:hypothetical protein